MEENNIENKNSTQAKPKKRSKIWSFIRPALVGTLVLTCITGIVYPIVTTVVAQTVFPYEANGSQVTVTLKDGTTKTYGSELIGQEFEDPTHLFGRVNTGAPTNLNPNSQEYKDLINKRIDERKQKLAEIEYYDDRKIPDELLTTSGSGVDPHISPETAYFQIPVIVEARNKDEDAIKYTEDDVKKVIDKYTEQPFLYIFGEKRVNVLLVNLALDGLI